MNTASSMDRTYSSLHDNGAATLSASAFRGHANPGFDDGAQDH